MKKLESLEDGVKRNDSYRYDNHTVLISKDKTVGQEIKKYADKVMVVYYGQPYELPIINEIKEISGEGADPVCGFYRREAQSRDGSCAEGGPRVEKASSLYLLLEEALLIRQRQSVQASWRATISGAYGSERSS